MIDQCETCPRHNQIEDAGLTQKILPKIWRHGVNVILAWFRSTLLSGVVVSRIVPFVQILFRYTWR
jgi:hypothetical protein